MDLSYFSTEIALQCCTVPYHNFFAGVQVVHFFLLKERIYMNGATLLGHTLVYADFLIKFKATILTVHRKVESAYSIGLSRVVEMVCCQSWEAVPVCSLPIACLRAQFHTKLMLESTGLVSRLCHALQVIRHYLSAIHDYAVTMTTSLEAWPLILLAIRCNAHTSSSLRKLATRCIWDLAKQLSLLDRYCFT